MLDVFFFSKLSMLFPNFSVIAASLSSWNFVESTPGHRKRFKHGWDDLTRKWTDARIWIN